MAPFLVPVPSTHVPFGAVLNEAAGSKACFVVYCAAGRAKTFGVALHAATNGGGLVRSSAVVMRAAKRSGGVEDGQYDDHRTGKANDASADGVVFGTDRTAEEKARNEDSFVFAAGTDRMDEITMEELVGMFQNETAILLKEVKQFPVDEQDDVLDSIIASCDALGEQIKKGKLLDKSEGQRIVNSLIALHLRIVSSAGGVALHNPGSYLPEMSVGHRHRLPPKGKRAGTTMELLLYSRLLAGAALRPYVIAAPAWDFTDVEGAEQGDDRTGKSTHDFLVGAGEERMIKHDDEHRTGEDDPSLFGYGPYGEMTMKELVRMFQSETSILLKDVKRFPFYDDGTVLDSLVASCEAIGDEIKKGKLNDSSEGQRIVNSLIALHLRVVSSAGVVKLHKPGSYLPDMWAGNRHRLPRKAKRAGTMMEVLLYSRMLAGAALAPYTSPPVWDFTGVEGAGSEMEEAD